VKNVVPSFAVTVFTFFLFNIFSNIILIVDVPHPPLNPDFGALSFALSIKPNATIAIHRPLSTSKTGDPLLPGYTNNEVVTHDSICSPVLSNHLLSLTFPKTND